MTLYIIEITDPQVRKQKRARYWRPEGQGYTPLLAEAGVFTEHDLFVVERLPGGVLEATSHSHPVQLPAGLTLTETD